jgi:hypothetical protein
MFPLQLLHFGAEGNASFAFIFAILTAPQLEDDSVLASGGSLPARVVSGSDRIEKRYGAKADACASLLTTAINRVPDSIENLGGGNDPRLAKDAIRDGLIAGIKIKTYDDRSNQGFGRGLSLIAGRRVIDRAVLFTTAYLYTIEYRGSHTVKDPAVTHDEISFWKEAGLPSA